MWRIPIRVIFPASLPTPSLLTPPQRHCHPPNSSSSKCRSHFWLLDLPHPPYLSASSTDSTTKLHLNQSSFSPSASEPLVMLLSHQDFCNSFLIVSLLLLLYPIIHLPHSSQSDLTKVQTILCHLKSFSGFPLFSKIKSTFLPSPGKFYMIWPLAVPLTLLPTFFSFSHCASVTLAFFLASLELLQCCSLCVEYSSRFF